MGDLWEKLQLRDGAESLSYFSLLYTAGLFVLGENRRLIVDLQSAGAPALCVFFVSL
jgi:hypothetical protein